MMVSALKLLLTDSTTYQTLFTALLTATYASYRANENLLKSRSPTYQSSSSLPSSLIDDNSRILQGPLALAFPLVATLSILLLFFFISSIGIILTALSAVSGFFSLLFLFWPLSQYLSRRLRMFPPLNAISSSLLESTLTGVVSTLIILTWLFSGHWVANNVIGISLCILFASLCKVPSLKVTVVLFSGLFLYDIFFVFFSERVFGRNIMVEVATSTPTNPAAAIATLFHLPFAPVKNLALPAKLIFPADAEHHTILGLGDIILPEVLLVYLLEFDLKNRGTTPIWKGYFVRALVAYVAGLFASFYFSFAFQAAQPALLYIVPFVLLITVFVAAQKGDLRKMWRGNDGRAEGEGSGEEAVYNMGLKELEEESLIA